MPQLNEPVIRALKERLDESLIDVIDRINASPSVQDDQLLVEPPAQILDFIPTPAILTEYPTIGIGDGPTELEDDTGHSATGRHHILIVAYIQDADLRALAWRLRRTSQAIVECVLEGRRLGEAWGVGLERVTPGPALADNDDPAAVRDWLSWIGVRIWAKTDEDW